MSRPPAPTGARLLHHERLYRGRILDLDRDRVEEPEGVVGEREVVRQRGSVAVLPVADDGRVTLVRQYRYAVDARVWELPAGRLEPGEAPAQAALRELEEEAGLRAHVIEPLLRFWTTPGFCDEEMHVFRATQLEPVPPRPDHDERIETRSFSGDELEKMIRTGEIREAKTLVALLLEMHRPGGFRGARR